MKKNIILGVLIWLFGTTVIGIPIVYGIIGYRGFCFGYTIASFLMTLGAKKGILISISSLFIQNIFFIPSIILIASSGLKLYKKREDIKYQIYKHSIISIIGLLGLILSSIIEVFISTNCMNFLGKYI